jgi:adenylate cyclase
MVTLRLLDPFLLESARLSFFDSMQRGQDAKQSEQIVLIDIDELTLEEFGQYPIPRETMADELVKLNNSILGINILLSEPDRFGGDDALADALFDMNAVVSIAPNDKTNIDSRPKPVGVATFGERDAVEFRPELEGMLFARPEIMDAAIGYGTMSSTQDTDGITRRVPLIENFEGRMYPAFALDILRVAAGDVSYQVKTDDYGIRFVRIPKFDVVQTDDNSNVRIAFWNEFKRYSFTEIDQIPAGSIAILGATFKGTSVVSTPVGAMYPHDIQANLLKTMIDGVTITRMPEFKFYELFATIVVSIVILFMLSKLSIVISGVVFLIISSSFVNGASLIFDNTFMLLDPIFPVITFVIIFAHGSFVQFYTQFKAKQMIKGQFGTYLSPDMVDMLAKDPSLMKLGGERKEMTFLFMDICGFTPISEHYKNNDDP